VQRGREPRACGPAHRHMLLAAAGPAVDNLSGARGQTDERLGESPDSLPVADAAAPADGAARPAKEDKVMWKNSVLIPY